MPWAAAAGAAVGYALNATDPLGGKDTPSGGGGGTKSSGSIWDQSPDTIASTVAALANAQNANPTDAEKQQLESLKRSNEIAGSMWQRYQQVYQPLQDKVINDASTMDSPENQDRVAGVANADVTGAFDRARQASLERLRSLGVNPNSGAFIEANQRLAGQEAATNAGLQNTARQNLITQGRTARSAAAGVGTNMPNQAMTGFQTQGQQFGAAATGIRAGRGTDNAALGKFLSPVIGGVRDWFKGQGGSGDYGINNFNSSNGLQISSGGVADEGYGSGYGDQYAQADFGGGYYADGGLVRGPGTGTSDSIPVAVRGPGGVSRGHISENEFIVPADVVRAKGVEFFNKLIEQYHTPARGVRR